MSKLSGLGGRLYRGETSIEIIGHRRRWYAVSALFILLSLGALSLQGLHLGIEFKGGSSYTVTKVGATVEEARSAVESAGVSSEVIVQTVGNDKIRVQTGSLSTVQSNAVQDALAAKFAINVETIDTQIIGPSWGKEITKKAIPNNNIISFSIDLNVDEFGANFFSKSGFENLRCILFFHHKTNRKTTIITGIIANK